MTMKNELPITNEALLAPIKASSQFKSWCKSHATEQKAADEQRRRAGAFADIAGEAEATLANRKQADPQELVRASSDLRAAAREQLACLAEAQAIEAKAILAGEHGEATVRFATDHLMAVNSEQHATLAAEIDELAKRHAVQIVVPDALTLPPMRLYDQFAVGGLDDRISALWYMLQ